MRTQKCLSGHHHLVTRRSRQSKRTAEQMGEWRMGLRETGCRQASLGTGSLWLLVRGNSKPLLFKPPWTGLLTLTLALRHILTDPHVLTQAHTPSRAHRGPESHAPSRTHAYSPSCLTRLHPFPVDPCLLTLAAG